ncbi:deoxyribonuclease V [Endozoicomonas sp. SM1973]|uniref:Endonuclease V n=1 Tax=Spartinivicinus marinus TaxID=2994442 RepID=A0A853ICK8_9GAMM|nr:deoxyribonuclease V [Spartinivicinus marinus]MCX4026398.1 deoxyribonuclease V [Spartinivicinus marinus]NYZ67257.1 deoxyribonuclease V [Spartinivicinus marinus]
MKPVIEPHPWDLAEAEALELQGQLAAKVIKEDKFSEIHYVAGVDVAYEKHSNQLIAAVVVLNASTLQIVETATASGFAQFPYIPGLFSFRELPPLIKALEKLSMEPDLIICDGQGIAHPRRFGLACHLGVLYNIPTIGCGKTRLIGEAGTIERVRGSCAELIDNEEVIGCVLRTQSDVKPIYVSIGHRVCLATACEWILKLSPKYRLPETTRQADQLVNKLMTKANNG